MAYSTADDARNAAASYLETVSTAEADYAAAITAAADKGLFSTIVIGNLKPETVEAIAKKGFGIFKKGGSTPTVYSISWGPPSKKTTPSVATGDE
jgi:hypothetical protein